MFASLTKKQKEIFEYIRIYIQMHGYAPSLYEIKNQFRLSAVSTVHEHIQNLKRKGYLKNEMNQARSLQPLNPEQASAQTIDVPIILQAESDAAYSEDKNPQLLVLHNSYLDKDAAYFGLKLNHNLYQNYGMLKGDVIVCKEQTTINPGDIFLLASRSKLAFARCLKKGDKLVLEKLLAQENLQKNFQVRGKIVYLWRKY